MNRLNKIESAIFVSLMCSLLPEDLNSELGWSGGAMVLGKLPVPGRPTNLDYSRARAYCACSECGWDCLDIFSLVYHSSFLSPSLWETARYRLKYCLKGPLSPNQPTNQPNNSELIVSLLQLVLCRVAAVKCLPIYHHSANYIF